LINRIIFGDEYRSLSSSLCSLLHSPVTSSLLGPNIRQHHYGIKYKKKLFQLMKYYMNTNKLFISISTRNIIATTCNTVAGHWA
jgi:hypothetical protein